MGEGFANPVTNAIGTLVRTVLKSANYVAGSAGWRIAKDGSAEFNNATIRGSLTIGGASPNPRIVYGNTIPAELVAWGTPLNVTFNSLVLYYRNSTDYFFQGIGTFSGIPLYVVGAYNISDGPYIVERILDLGGASNGRIEFRLGSYALNTYTMKVMTQQAQVQMGTGGNSPGDTFVVNGLGSFGDTGEPGATGAAEYTLDAFGATVETWNAITLQNGWTGFLRYRRVTSPPRSVQLIGNMVAGTKADGTLLGTLPANYSPASNAQDIMGNAFGGTLPTSQPPHVNIGTSGAILLYGIGTSSNLNINGIFALDV